MMLTQLTVLVPLSLSVLLASAATIQLEDATVSGITKDSVTSYTGIPFAYPPCVSLLCTSCETSLLIHIGGHSG